MVINKSIFDRFKHIYDAKLYYQLRLLSHKQISCNPIRRLRKNTSKLDVLVEASIRRFEMTPFVFQICYTFSHTSVVYHSPVIQSLTLLFKSPW